MRDHRRARALTTLAGLLLATAAGCAGAPDGAPSEDPPSAHGEPNEAGPNAAAEADDDAAAAPSPDEAHAPTAPPWATAAEHPDVVPEPGPWIRSRGAFVVDRASGEVLYARRADHPRPMASIVKLMAALVVADEALDPDAVVGIAREDAVASRWTRSPLYVGTSYRAGDVLHHALLESDNRAIAALARSSGLGAAGFADAMNARAEELGMSTAHFVEPTGIDADNRCSPYEAGLLLEACLSHPLLGGIVGLESFAFDRVDRPRSLVAHHTNMLMRLDHWRVLGSKTGYTCVAGSCLVMAAEITGRELLVSLMGHPDPEMRFHDAAELRWWLQEMS